MSERDDYADGPTPVHWVHSPRDWAILALLLTVMATLAGLPLLIVLANKAFP